MSRYKNTICTLALATALAIPGNAHSQDLSVLDWGEASTVIFNSVSLALGGYSFFRDLGEEEKLDRMRATIESTSGKIDEVHSTVTQARDEILEALADLKDTVIAQKEEQHFLTTYGKTKSLDSYLDRATEPSFVSFSTRRTAGYDRLVLNLIDLAHESDAQSKSVVNGLFLATSNYMIADALYQVYYIDSRLGVVDKALFVDAIDALMISSSRLSDDESPISTRIEEYEKLYLRTLNNFVSSTPGLSFSSKQVTDRYDNPKIMICQNYDMEQHEVATSAHVRCPATYSEARTVGRRLCDQNPLIYVLYCNNYSRSLSKCNSYDRREFPSIHTFHSKYQYTWKRDIGVAELEYVRHGKLGQYLLPKGIRVSDLEELDTETRESALLDSRYEINSFENERAFTSASRDDGTYSCGTAAGSNAYSTPGEPRIRKAFGTTEKELAEISRVLAQNIGARNLASDLGEFLTEFKAVLTSDRVDL